MRSLRFLLILFAVTLLSGVATAQPAVNRAGVVVRFGNGEVFTTCVTFGEPSISGLELLERSGLPVISQQSSIGAAVCKIGYEGCDYPATSCFCAREQGRVVYWAFYLRDQSGWRYSNLGASNVQVSDGDLHGWAWGPGDASGGAVPPDVTFADVCLRETVAEPTTTPTATSEPTATAIVMPTQTPPRPTTAPAIPTFTPVPSATATAPAMPTFTPVPSATATAPAMPTSTPVPSPSATATVLPAGGVSQVTSPTSGDSSQWWGFIALVALLLGAIVVTLRRRGAT
ncbi:MAG: hypothetical protein KatS3mg055_1187 [Chloroflexus sp.]|uniref:hypothetical protein n=1 Tax=Chloroflexus sp. TaxID=1904827 RepID=UPI0021DC2587|nr:hypothetical protein [Chloroflexus sp.]GIV88669.1 MAG: hypothetical protein KatS3mg055_1187 [Chloroflexus sp.]